MQKNVSKTLARAGGIAALYTVCSLITLPVASGAIQFRLSEALCVLPLLFFESVPALFVGCFISNLITGCVVWDVVFGSLITLVAAIFTNVTGRLIKNEKVKFFAGGLFPVVLNAFLLPLVWYFCYGKLECVYVAQAAFLLCSQAVSVYAAGGAVYFSLLKSVKNGNKFLQ